MKYRLIIALILFFLYATANSQSNYYDSDNNPISIKVYDSLKAKYGGLLKIRKLILNGKERIVVYTPTKTEKEKEKEKKNIYQFFDMDGTSMSKGEFRDRVDNGETYRYEIVQSKEVGTTKLLIDNSVKEQNEKSKETLVTKYLNKTIPETDFYDLEGNVIDIKNKVVVINFWFTACRPCIREMTQLNRLTQKYKDEDVVFIAPALDKKEALIQFLDKTSFKYLVVPEMGKYVRDTLETFSFPTNMVIDQQGKVTFIKVGFSETIEQELSEHIDKLLLLNKDD